MINKIFLVISLFCLCFYLYGMVVTLTKNEKNMCKMTYMYEYPQFIKINFKENDDYPKYNLYAYSEGHLTEKARSMEFTGAPVLFIPGNSGSYKQVRSLASVALRKGIDNSWQEHLDYFTVDLNDELSGLYGGVLQEQTQYVGLCINEIIKLYQKLPTPPEKLVVIGHSLGGKIAQALLININTTYMINAVITLATPLDEPVLALDNYIHDFYENIRLHFKYKRIPNVITNDTNECTNCVYDSRGILNSTNDNIINKNKKKEKNSRVIKRTLNDKLIITIGGGERDLLVHSGLTQSKYSDLHAITTSIPNVWLSTDHLCTVWCLQLVMVINRFLFSIINNKSKKNSFFIEEKPDLLNKAKLYFAEENVNARSYESTIILANDMGEWIEDSRRVFTEQFKTGLNRTRIQMIRLVDMPQHKMLKVEVVNVETNDWIFGCAALDTYNHMRYCEKATSITHFARKLPSMRHERHYLLLDLHEIKKLHPDWTHVLLRFLPTKEPMQLNVDIHNPGDRELVVGMPKWYSFSSVKVLDDTVIGAAMYTIKVNGLEDPSMALELSVKPRSCSLPNYHSVLKLCVPWLKGFDRYHYLTETFNTPMYLTVPKIKPSGYNTTMNNIKVTLHLDPNCRYTIHVKNSFTMTIVQIVQQFSHWLPAHLVAIILLAMKHQISLTPKNEKFLCGSFHSALIKCSPIFIVTASRVFVKLIFWFKVLPSPEAYDLPMLISIVIHGSAFALLTLATGGLWVTICFFGNIAHRILFKLIQLPIPTISSILIPVIQKFPFAMAVLLISMATVSCGGIALICACIVYFILLTKMYEDYLEEFIFKTSQLIASKLFGKVKNDDAITEDVKESGEDIIDDKNASGDAKDTTIKDKDSVIKDENNKDDEEEKNNDEIKDVNDEVIKDENHVEDVSNEVEVLNDKNSDDNSQVDKVSNIDIDKGVDAELEKLLKETMDKSEKQNAERMKELAAARFEYDHINVGLNNINFHLPLIFLLFLLTILNMPSVVTWARNYQYSSILNSDPSFIPACIVLLALAMIWQMDTPRDISYYNVLAGIFYVTSAISVLYCQNSIYRLNYIIPIIFCIIAIHQVLTPQRKFDPNIARNDIKDRVERMRAMMLNEPTNE